MAVLADVVIPDPATLPVQQTTLATYAGLLAQVTAHIAVVNGHITTARAHVAYMQDLLNRLSELLAPIPPSAL